ncbi:MAG: alcohol dehydrogenase catalytic domain-containing protein [Bacteroidota bacterium]|nr:alcohol dehydrogenase catalytic domain-containing protein [Bacteroidota bacterium]
MRALVYKGAFQIDLQQVPDPRPLPHEVLVRIDAVGICGSDVHGYTGTTGRRLPPLIMGHEAAGRVAEPANGFEAGEEVCFDSTVGCTECSECASGQVNRCTKRTVFGVSTPRFRRDGAMADFVCVPAHVLRRVPDGLPLNIAAMFEPLSVGSHAVRRGGNAQNARVLIIGAGMIGLSILLCVQLQEPSEIIVIEPHENRKAMARQIGADRVLDPENSAQTIDADLTFEAVGASSTVAQAIHHTKPGGRIVLVGNTSQHPPVDVQRIVAKELTLTGTYANAGEYDEIINLVSRQQLDPSPLISTTLPLEDGPEAFDRLYRQAEPEWIKVLLHT